MSNRLKHKKKQFGFTSQEVNGIARVSRSTEMKNAMLKEIFKHLQFMGYMALRDRYGFGAKRIVKFWEKVAGVFDAYQDERLTSKQMLKYCEKKKIEPMNWVRSISQSEKLSLCNYKRYHCGTVETIKMIDASVLVYALITAVVLKEEFNFSTPEVERFYGHISYYIDSYVKNYLNDDMINSIMLDECGIDLKKGA